VLSRKHLGALKTTDYGGILSVQNSVNHLDISEEFCLPFISIY